MDPYARVRVGHFVYETQTDANGGKTPRWNRVIHSQLPAGVSTVSIEIYDECSFKMDELIAWTEVRIPESVLKGQTHEEWHSLSGKQGDHVEGMVDVVMSFVVSIDNEFVTKPVFRLFGNKEMTQHFCYLPAGRSDGTVSKYRSTGCHGAKRIGWPSNACVCDCSKCSATASGPTNCRATSVATNNRR